MCYAVVLLVFAGCSASSGVPAGLERGPCLADGTCSGGLDCLSDVCVNLATKSDAVVSGDAVGQVVLCEPCAGADDNCDDGNPCTWDECVEGGCTHHPLAADRCACDSVADCDDGNPCSEDFCINSLCFHGLYGDNDVPEGCCANTFEACLDADGCHKGVCCDSSSKGCTLGTCHAPTSCCVFDADCDNAPTYTSYDCVEETCRYLPMGCSSDGDCDHRLICDATINRCMVGQRKPCPDGSACRKSGECEPCEGGVCTSE